MSRNIASEMTSASNLETVRFRLLCEIYSMTGGAVARTCTGMNYVVFNSNTFSPVGNLGGADPVQEESDVFPRSVKLWFSAINSAAITEVISENMFNKPVILYRTFLTDSYTCVSTPEKLFQGRVNTCEMKLKDPERGNYFELEIESKLSAQPPARYFDRETLRSFYAQSASILFDFVHQIPFVKADWGGMTVGAASTIPGGAGPGPGGRGTRGQER